MKTFRVTAEVTISMSTLVEAVSAAAARKEALNRGMVSLCHQCATGNDREEWITSGELDGEPVELRASEEEQ